MYTGRLFPWIAGSFVLGEISGICELSAGLRCFAGSLFLCMLLLLAACRAPEEDLRNRKPFFKSRGLEKGPLLFFLCCFLFFLAGFFRAAAVSGEFSQPQHQAFFSRYGIRNPGEFDYGLYLKGLGISSEEALEAYRQGGILSSGLPYFSTLGSLRQRCMEVLDALLPQKDAGLYRALLLGDKSEMDEGVRDLYQSQGIAHLLAVSGLHVGIIGMGFFRLLRFLGMGLSGAGLWSALLVVSYGFLTGAQGSAVRAVVMLLAKFLSLRLGRSYDSLSALGLSALLLAAAHPYILLQSGFQLSFGAILAISLLGEHLLRALELERENRSRKTGFVLYISHRGRLPGAVRTVFTSTAIQFFTLPLILYHFFTFPPYGILLNFIVIPLMGFVLCSGLLALCLGLLTSLLQGSPLLAPAAGFLWLLARGAAGAGHYILLFYEQLCSITKKFPASSILLGRPELKEIVLYYFLMLAGFVLLFFPFFCRKRLWELPEKGPAPKPLKNRFSLRQAVIHGLFQRFFRRLFRIRPELRALLYFLLLILSAGLFVKSPPKELEITAIDVGQGDGFLIRYQDTSILIDGGSTSESELGKYTLEPVLLSQGVSRLSAAIISHCDTDHTSGLSYLLSNTPELTIERLLLPKAAREDPAYDPLKAFFSQEDIHYFSEGDRLSLPGGPELLCLYPGRVRTPELNSHSEALLLRYGGFSMLFTGDMMKGDEALLAKALRQHQALSEGLFLPGRLTVYKAAHHGSRSSNSDLLLKQFAPEYVLFSYGENNSYGHPHREVVERFSHYGAKPLMTGRSGGIRLLTDGRRLRIIPFLRD